MPQLDRWGERILDQIRAPGRPGPSGQVGPTTTTKPATDPVVVPTTLNPPIDQQASSTTGVPAKSSQGGCSRFLTLAPVVLTEASAFLPVPTDLPAAPSSELDETQQAEPSSDHTLASSSNPPSETRAWSPFAELDEVRTDFDRLAGRTATQAIVLSPTKASSLTPIDKGKKAPVAPPPHVGLVLSQQQAMMRTKRARRASQAGKRGQTNGPTSGDWGTSPV